MPSLKFEQSIEGVGDYVADAAMGDWIFEVKRKLRDVRSLRGALQQAAYIAASNRDRHAILILEDPEVTADRVHDEWKLFTRILDRDLENRIAVVGIIPGFGLNWLAGTLPEDFTDWKTTVHEILHNGDRSPAKVRSNAFYDVMRTLLVHWLRRHPPVSAKQLTEETGFSYPTIATALEKLSAYLARGPHRSVALRTFPLDAWAKLLASSDEIRITRRFSVEGRSRSPEKMVERLRELGVADIAVGGVLGARHWYPGIDLVGTPRLDLTVNFPMPAMRNWPTPDAPIPHDFIRKLDPALRPASGSAPASVVVHCLLTPEPFFERSKDDTVWANEAECLLDLQELRLEAQANEFVEHLTRS